MEYLELVPNVSEGRSAAALEDVASAFTRGPGIWLLDVHRDPFLNRSVLTAVARPEAALEAVLRLMERSIARIDMRVHRGEHPRIGAVDVLPFVPLGKTSRKSAIDLAVEAGREIARRFDLPIFLYGEAALEPSDRELPALRRGGFEALSRRLGSSELVPDFGPRAPHPTAGATAVGVRDFLIAYNVELSTGDRSVAEAIARRIRASGGGLPHVRALGFQLGAEGPAIVSMNLTDFRVTPLETAFEAVERQARRLGVEVVRSEVVGLLPEAADAPGMKQRLKLDTAPGILEERMQEAGIPRASPGAGR